MRISTQKRAKMGPALRRIYAHSSTATSYNTVVEYDGRRRCRTAIAGLYDDKDVPTSLCTLVRRAARYNYTAFRPLYL